VTGERFALVAGGGTAGHLQPALAIAEALVEEGHPRDTIEFVGSERGQDRSALDGRGFPFTLLPGRGIVRSLAPRDLAANLGAVIGLATALVRGFGVVARSRPQVVVSVGGYASLAASTAAVVLRVPLVLVNVDAVPGAANRLFGRFARASAVGWAGNPLPRAVVTGTPVRPEIAAVRRDQADRRAARRELGLPEDRLTVAVFGGSLGARRINQAATGLAEAWADRTDRSVYHVVGQRDWDAEAGRPGRPAGREEAGLRVVRVPYEQRMDLLYAAADLVVCRAGAMTVAELAVAGVPSVLVPLPGAPGDHQTANARVLERAGASVLLADRECDAPTLAVTLDRMLADPVGLDAMGRAARSLGRRDAARAGARLVEAHARGARRAVAR
jgi:UDP-N-acetylglucosamine--N-acetylmuramyl-(pentapeptide) pyrophosphoryl-undecaprenol N-acetylglucosamine transferase